MKKSLNKIIESGIIVSLFLGLAYYFTYQHQKGVISYYDLPMKYIDLSLENVVEIFIYILVLFLAAFSIMRIVSINTHKPQTYKGKQIIFVTVFCAFLIVLSFALLKSTSQFIWKILGLYFLYLIYSLFAPLIFFRKEKDLSKKWILYSSEAEKNFSIEEEAKNPSIFYPYGKTIALICYVLVVVLFVGGIFETSGKEKAQYSEEYYIAKSYSDKVVVYHTKEFYVLMESNEGVLKNEFQIVSADEIGTLKKEKTGVLKLENK